MNNKLATPLSRFKSVVILLMVFGLSACVNFGGPQGQASHQQNPWADLPPYEWPPFQQSYAEDLNLGPAPRGLLEEADNHYEGGRMGASAAALERALRLAPRSPVLWYRLAGLRAAQGDYAAANRLSEKASSLVTAASGERVGYWLDWLNQWLLDQLRPAQTGHQF